MIEVHEVSDRRIRNIEPERPDEDSCPDSEVCAAWAKMSEVDRLDSVPILKRISTNSNKPRSSNCWTGFCNNVRKTYLEGVIQDINN